jgi:hypothetical protein
VHVTNAGNDGINVVGGAHDIMITNCTSYGNRDGNIDVADGYNVTVQYCILGGGASGWSGAMLITGRSTSVHHNLITPSTSGEVGERCPLIHCNYSTVGAPNADFRNNLVWKWGRNAGTGSGYGTSVAYNATANVVNNYYYSDASPGSAVNADDGYGSGATGKVYASGNVSGNSGVNPNSENNHAIYSIASAAAVATQDACTAAGLVLANAGPSPRNTVDLAFINAVTLQGCSVTTPTNQAPTVSAGSSKTITLPVNSVTLTGTASDPDGSIVSYAWTKVSGPAATIASPSSISTSITGLTAGTYIFNLKVTDNGGATANSNVTVTVNAATTTNLAPTVSAGSAQTITLPLNSVILTGTASDPDGIIASYAWTKTSGPAATIASPSSISTSITGLTAGTYIFNLKVTDNGGTTANSSVTVTVNSAPVTTAPSTSFGTLAYSQGYDVSSSVTTANGIRNKVSYTLYKTGPGSFMSKVRYLDASLSNGYRGEMIYTGSTYNPAEAVIEYDVYYQNWKNWGGGGSTIMWQPGTSGASAVLGLQNYDGKFKIVRAINGAIYAQGGTLKTVSPNTWYKMRWEVKWSSGTDGYIRLYIDGVLYYSFTGATTDGSGVPTLRVGQYRWNIVSGTNTVVYYDNLKIYRK